MELDPKTNNAELQRPCEYLMYDQISSLNNQLINIQRELAKKNAQLQKVIEEKNQFLGMVVHDMRNPLSIIYSYSQLMTKENFIGNSEIETYFLGIVKTYSEFMLKLVSELMEVSEIESGKLFLHIEVINIIELIERIINLNQILAAEKDIEIRFHTKVLELCIPVDKYKIMQVMNNLISNAIKFSNPKNKVEVTVAVQDGYVVIGVEDRGIGIAENNQKLIFRPFVTINSNGTNGEKNTGLGLFISKNIVDAHNGIITVKSKQNVGSTFTVRLPLHSCFSDTHISEHRIENNRRENNRRENNRRENNRTENIRIVNNRVKDYRVKDYRIENNRIVNNQLVRKDTFRIMVVEDNEINAMVAELIIKEMGHNITLAKSGTEAICLYEKDAFDYILIDIELPEMNGYELCKKLRSIEDIKQIRSHMIGVSAYSGEEFQKKCQLAGMDYCITKPLEKELLIDIFNYS